MSQNFQPPGSRQISSSFYLIYIKERSEIEERSNIKERSDIKQRSGKMQKKGICDNKCTYNDNDNDSSSFPQTPDLIRARCVEKRGQGNAQERMILRGQLGNNRPVVIVPTRLCSRQMLTNKKVLISLLIISIV